MSGFPDASTIDQRPIAVLGAGTLGRRIAVMYATRGGEVRLYDTSVEAAAKGADWALVELAKLVPTIEGGLAGQIVPMNDLDATIADAWMVVEAVPEVLDLKKSIFAELDAKCTPDTILASNSSSFPTSRFVGHLSRPERVLNTHFLMPPGLRPVELMSCGVTDQAIIDGLVELLPRWGLSPYVAHAESVGFIFNRIWAAVKRESIAVLAEGIATAPEIDAIYTEATGEAGPFRRMDQVGLDIVLNIEEHYAEERPDAPVEVRDLLKRYVAEGKLGAKTGEGFYDDYRRDDAHA